VWKSGEPHRLLELDVAVDLHVGACPELIQVMPLLCAQPRPAGLAGGGERGDDLVFQSGTRAKARPAVGDELDQAQPFPGSQRRDDRDARDVRLALGQDLSPLGTSMR
jgi:hypothetical protein